MRPTDCELSLNQGTAFSSNTEWFNNCCWKEDNKDTKNIFLVQTSHARILRWSLCCFNLFFICYALVLTFLTKLLKTKNISFYYSIFFFILYLCKLISYLCWEDCKIICLGIFCQVSPLAQFLCSWLIYSNMPFFQKDCL